MKKIEPKQEQLRVKHNDAYITLVPGKKVFALNLNHNPGTVFEIELEKGISFFIKYWFKKRIKFEPSSQRFVNFFSFWPGKNEFLRPIFPKTNKPGNWILIPAKDLYQAKTHFKYATRGLKDKAGRVYHVNK